MTGAGSDWKPPFKSNRRQAQRKGEFVLVASLHSAPLKGRVGEHSSERY